MIRSFHKRARLVSTVAIMLSLASQPAWAQQSPDAESDGEIVVTGQALANKRAIDAKRDAIAIVDAVAADDIGNLPDFNAGDALRRVTGVNVLTYQGEPRFITIRGLNADYINSTVDGFQVASPDPGGRKLFTEVLPRALRVASRCRRPARLTLMVMRLPGRSTLCRAISSRSVVRR